MRVMHFFLFVLFAQSYCIDARSVDPEWPEFPIPENSQLLIVSSNMVFNGIPMKNWELTTLLSPQKLKEFYLNNWQFVADGLKAGAPGYQVVETKNITIISRMEGEYLLTVQMSNKTKAARAYLAISKVVDEHRVPFIMGENFPALTGTVFINDITAVDGMKTSRTIIAVSEAPFKSVVGFYRATYKKNGWVEMSQSLPVGNKGLGLMFNKKNKEANIAITPKDGKVNIVAVQVEH